MARLNALSSQLQTELTGARQRLVHKEQELASAMGKLAEAQQEITRLLDVLKRRPQPLWEMLIFRRSGRPKKVFRRVLFHKSGKPRGIFRKWILMPDGRPQAAFQMWMSSPEYQSMRGAVRFSSETHSAPVTLSPDAQQIARRVAALRSPSSRK